MASWVKFIAHSVLVFAWQASKAFHVRVSIQNVHPFPPVLAVFSTI